MPFNLMSFSGADLILAPGGSSALNSDSDEVMIEPPSENNEVLTVHMASSSLEELDTCKLGRVVCAVRLSLMEMCGEFFEKALPCLVLK